MLQCAAVVGRASWPGTVARPASCSDDDAHDGLSRLRVGDAASFGVVDVLVSALRLTSSQSGSTGGVLASVPAPGSATSGAPPAPGERPAPRSRPVHGVRRSARRPPGGGCPFAVLQWWRVGRTRAPAFA
jgi:hypothetical protein